MLTHSHYTSATLYKKQKLLLIYKNSRNIYLQIKDVGS
jgi:hypothetical protein